MIFDLQKSEKSSIAETLLHAYTCQVRLRSTIITLAVIPFALLFGAGCGGLATAQSVSPLSFLLPGLLGANQTPHEDPSLQAAPPPDSKPETVVARAN
jgi:hypothetical protein